MGENAKNTERNVLDFWLMEKLHALTQFLFYNYSIGSYNNCYKDNSCLRRRVLKYEKKRINSFFDF